MWEKLKTYLFSTFLGAIIGYTILSPLTMYISSQVFAVQIEVWEALRLEMRSWSMPFTFFGGAVGLSFGILYNEIIETTNQRMRAEQDFRDYVFEVADNLRNPLQVFLAYLDEFETSNFTGDQKRHFEKIMDATNLVSKNIEKLTDAKRLFKKK